MDSNELNIEVPLAVPESDNEDVLLGEEEINYNHSILPEPGSCWVEEEDSLSGSLEDLVNSFDEKLTMAFQNYEEKVDKMAPVQVRSQEDILKECQVWWTITGNFGNMMPIDWTKSSTRSKQFPVLNLCAPHCRSEDISLLQEEDDIVAADLDMHTLILNSNAHLDEPVKTADEIIKEIDEIIKEEYDESENNTCNNLNYSNIQHPKMYFFGPVRILDKVLEGRKLNDLSLNELILINGDIELLVRELSEELVGDLGIRDELEFEKELKNTFISLLLNIQSKLRQINRKNSGKPSTFKYLTTVIPYQVSNSSPPVSILQVLVKILKAINEDSPAVPALLTDYILKILCPS
ncbi:fasciculation and elongation protein zeta-2 [Lepeophtheirus salmonis]|uniref:Fasciculation and elongation protein zeta-2 n=2 Tax=Lepeophtheirus salmonis TaxID=72036 RepID=D3PIR9_LEPSM|nr:fasciculation and elongation protein zeta-2-like [Lepeophtheirus salmonis]ADD38455.1 Fasciculation and elongation protein zeta-2 [Lepeophtheirus salmonis]